MMKQKLLSFIAVVVILFLAPGTSMGQTVTLTPEAIPNGIASLSGELYHQRIDIRFGGTASAAAALNLIRGVTITLPSEVAVDVTTITSTGSVAFATLSGVYLPTTANNTAAGNGVLEFAVTGTGAANQTLTIEFDVTTPTSFTGIPTGTKVDTSISVQFAPSLGSTQTVATAKHNNLQVREIHFSAPDETNGDTTSAGGRFYKLAFPSLPDLSHSDLSGVTQAMAGIAAVTDQGTDVMYSFYLSTDSTLIERPLTLGETSFFTSLSALPTGSQVPLLGTRQNPRIVDRTFIRADYNTVWATAAGDSVAGIISLAGTQDNTTYFVYVLADPAADRLASNMSTATGKKTFDASVRGAFTGGVFLGRSGPLFVQHPPEFVIAGWDYDNDGNDDFSTTGVVQVPGDAIGMTPGGGTQKDNVNATIDTGDFFGQSTAGTALSSFNTGNVPGPTTTIPLIYVADDIDDPSNFQMNIILSTNSGLGVTDLHGGGIDSFDVASSVRIPGTDTLTTGFGAYTFDPIVRDNVTNLITSYVPEGTYNVYFVATDGTHRTVYQAVDDPFQSSPTAATLRVRHSPNIQTVDAFSLNDFDGDGDLDVITGIEVSQMASDADGKNLSAGPAQRYVNVFWGNAGLDADLDVDDDATINLYYSTRSTFRAVGASVAYTSGNSDGTDLLSAITQGNNDTHLFASGIKEDPDGLFDDSYAWDLWNYVSPEGTVPRTGVRYYVYGLLSGGSTRRLESFTSSGGIVFEHPPYARILEPSQDITVTIDEPVTVQWEAFDVDNGEQAGLGAVPIGQSGRISPNSSTDSNNLRILLTTADFGEVTSYGSITSASTANLTPFWLGNSTDGTLGGEIELNEGVDSAFVIQGRNMTANIGNTNNATLDLPTNGGLGTTYFVYLAVDRGAHDGIPSGQSAVFDAASPLVRGPGRITFTGSVPALPSTSARFTIPTRLTAVSNQTIQFPIIPDEGDATGATSIDVVDIFLTVDPALFEAVDTDPNTAGVQPFGIGANSQITGSNVSQAAYIDKSGLLRLDFIYNTGGGSGQLTFFDNQQILATANLKALPLSGGATVATTISLDNSGTRVSKMISGTSTLGLAIPAPAEVDIVRRAQMSGTIPLQGRTTSADTVTVVLREVGDLIPSTDSLFALNDTDASIAGVQIITTGVNGDFTLENVPSGRFILMALVPRHLAGHDTIDVSGGLDISGLQPTLDGEGIDRTFLLAGDAAGYSDSTGTNVPDNQVGAADINAVNAALFSQPGDSNFNTFADINRDDIVNGTDKDFTTVNTTDNTGAAGNIVPVFPNFKQAVVEGNNAEAVLMLKDLPTAEVSPGETFDVTIAVEGAVSVRTYEFHLAYDPEMIEVADLVSQGTLFQNYRFDLGGKNEGGDLGLVNSILGRTPVGASGEGTLATIRFRAISRSAETSLALTDALLIDVDHQPATPQLTGGAMIVLSSDPIAYHDASGERVLGLILADQDAIVDFNDFVAFAGAFGTSTGDAQYDFRADLNGDDAVDFTDFIIFAENFGRTAVDAPAARRAGKQALSAGVNAASTLGLAVMGEARMGELLTLSATVADAQALQGWGFSVAYDVTQYEFVEARAPESNLLESTGGDAPLFFVNDESGVVSLASAISAGPVASGGGAVAELVFRPIGDIESGLFDVANGVVFDPNQLQNRLGTPGSLEVRALPTEFALNQNFPNPFNPETTIAYDLADGGRVELEIYNVMGQMVMQLVSEEQPAGRYRVVWDGADAIGRSVASGVYFYRLNTTQYNAVRKLMLLK